NTEVTVSMNQPIEAFVSEEGSIPTAWRATHPTADEWVESKIPVLEKITLPTLLCATFSDQGVHTPGGFKAFQRIGAQDKWLYTHRWLKWDSYYSDEVQALTKQFMDCFVRGERDNGFFDRPRVRVEIRETRDAVAEVRHARAWPPSETEYRRLYLDPATKGLHPDAPADAQTVSYDARSGRAVFQHRFSEDTRVVGHMALHLHIGVQGADDALLAVVIEKRAVDGQRVRFFGTVGNKDDVVSRGFLAVAMRELDDASTEVSPKLTLRNRQPLQDGEIVPVAIELHPHATLFRAGETLELVIAGHELAPTRPLIKDFSANRGVHILHAGGDRPSFLVVPTLPALPTLPAGDAS
ncbi:MAG: CocE/NonD family hydrolase, partial [Myxococcota bacterium]